MSNKYGPRIVTDGLVLCLDAADSNSYPGSGTSWGDLSGNNNNATFYNGPVFDSSNRGSISFDGTNDYAEVTLRNTNLEFQPTVPYSCFLFLKTPPTDVNRAIIANMYNGSTYPGWDLWVNGDSIDNTIAAHLIHSWNTNAIKIHWSYDFSTNGDKWISIALTYDGSCPTNASASISSMNLYINGVLTTNGKGSSNNDAFDSSTQSISYNTSQRFRVASRWLSGTAAYVSDIQVSTVLLYNNKQLSSSEVMQNHNATKGRFGL